MHVLWAVRGGRSSFWSCLVPAAAFSLPPVPFLPCLLALRQGNNLKLCLQGCLLRPFTQTAHRQFKAMIWSFYAAAVIQSQSVVQSDVLCFGRSLLSNRRCKRQTGDTSELCCPCRLFPAYSRHSSTRLLGVADVGNRTVVRSGSEISYLYLKLCGP